VGAFEDRCTISGAVKDTEQAAKRFRRPFADSVDRSG
jgi:hypothetical protein